MYAYNVKWHVTTNDTPQQIHEIGLAEVKRIRAEMDAVIASTGFKGSHDDFKRYLRTNPKFFFRDAASLLTAYRDIAKRADPELAHLFGRLPQTPYGVEAGARCRRAVADDRVLRAGIVCGGPSGQHVRQHVQARLAAKLGDDGADAARSGARPSHSDRARAGDGGTARVPQELQLHGVCRRVGAVRGVARRRDGPLQGSRTRSSDS